MPGICYVRGWALTQEEFVRRRCCTLHRGDMTANGLTAHRNDCASPVVRASVRWVHREDLRSFRRQSRRPSAGACDEWWHPASVDRRLVQSAARQGARCLGFCAKCRRREVIILISERLQISHWCACTGELRAQVKL
jgi:hypothetical protein